MNTVNAFLSALAEKIAIGITTALLQWLDRQAEKRRELEDIKTPKEVLAAWHAWLTDRLPKPKNDIDRQ